MIVTQETINISRQEWECYIHTPDAVIATINKEFSEILNTTTSPRWAQRRIYNFIDDYGHDVFGFADSECNQVITDVINKYYKSNISRWDCIGL